MPSDEQEWVVAPDDANIEIAIGPQAKLSPELREALQRLAQVMEQEQEVQGYLHCQKITIESCATYITCRGVAGG